MCWRLKYHYIKGIPVRTNCTPLSYLDLHLEIDSEGLLRTKLYNKRDDFNIPIVNFPFICSSIPAAPTYEIYISQLIRYSRACGSHQDFLDRRLLLTRMLLNQGFLLVMLKSSFQKCYGRHHDLVERYGISVSQMTTDTFHLSKHFMAYHLVCNQINTMGVISGARASYPSGTPEFIPGFQWGSCYSIYRFYRSLFVLYICMFCRLLFVLLYFFFLGIVCLFFFDIWILITPLVSSNSSYYDHLSFVYEKDMCNMNCLSYQCLNCFLSINVAIFVLLLLLVSQLLLTSTILRSDVSC